MEGFQAFETRRKKKFDKQIDSNVMISSKGLDEGVDQWNFWIGIPYNSKFLSTFSTRLMPLSSGVIFWNLNYSWCSAWKFSFLFIFKLF